MEIWLREQATALRPDVLVGHYGKSVNDKPTAVNTPPL
jgi:hypothetical protein